MTVSTTKNRIVFIGDGAVTTFSFDFKILKAEHAKVYRVVNDVETLLTLGTDYLITGLNTDAGGAVQMNTAPLSGEKLVIVRELLPVQETSLKNQGRFYPEVHEDAFDYEMMLIQQVANSVGSSDGASRLLALGVADTDGQGAYRAKGNRIINVGDPINENDVTRLKDIKPFADQAEAAQQAAEAAEASAEQAKLDAAESARQAAESATQIDPATYYTKDQTNTMFENLFDYFPIGFEIDWSHDAIPDSWLEENGQAIDPGLYPDLALLYPLLVLPDCSDRYVRYIGNKTGYEKYQLLEDTMQHITGEAGWNEWISGANAGKGFGLLTSSDTAKTYTKGAFKVGDGVRNTKNVAFSATSTAGWNQYDLLFDNAGSVRTSDENRPKTIMIKTRIVKAK